jgi:spore coat polysaccharide biosynthesis protein SpsF (cytidylyltransferase family)
MYIVQIRENFGNFRCSSTVMESFFSAEKTDWKVSTVLKFKCVTNVYEIFLRTGGMASQIMRFLLNLIFSEYTNIWGE